MMESVHPQIRQFASNFERYSAPAVLAEVSPEREHDTAPDFSTIDLSEYDQEAVVLLFEIVARTTGRWRKNPPAIWGSPAVLFKGSPVKQTEPAAVPPTNRPSIVMIGADTLRAQALGTWGKNPSVSPALDRLAAQSEVWLNAYSPFNATNPSFTSVHTGLYGKNHGVYDQTTSVPKDRKTLANQLSSAGYDTFAIFAAQHLASSGLEEDFDDFFKPIGTASAECVVDQALHRIDGLRRSGRPFFAFLHLFDPHTPHTPPEPFALGRLPARSFGAAPVAEWTTWRQPGRVEFESNWAGGGSKDLYHDEVAYMDRQIDRLLGHLEQWGLLDNTIVVFFADHGENLGEHGIDFRHIGLWRTTTHVPLMVRWPNSWHDQEAWRFRFQAKHQHLAQTIDLYPTLLQVAKAEIPPNLDARSLTSREHRKTVFFEHANRSGQGIRTEKYLLVELHDQIDTPNGTFLYDLEADPEETVNVALELPDVARALAAELDAWLAERNSSESPKRAISEQERRELESLGYLER